MGISVVIHTYNSEKYLEKCLESVKTCEEIVICDMHSTDRTIEIAQKYGAKIIYHENLGFADPARNFALSHATQDWVLVLDSDEEIPPALLEHLRELMTTLPKHIGGVFIPRKNLHLGQVLWLSYPNPILRFFKNGKVSFSEKVHCAPTIIDGGDWHIDEKRTDLAIIHYNHDDLESFISRMNTYTTLELEKFEERGVKFSIGLLLFRPIGEFIKRYFIKGGIKSGLHGFVFSVFLMIYKFTAAAKLWAKELKEKQNLT
ncbi:MAG: hypothetical protein A2Y25_07110 [Candidatus Melainabacteria bacterium GWF2_37_15]|nr:MAG: hypothetical protein A2Y25_07110 [Candidatus Melainabacteria bacterium GWF2_37_15]